MPKPSRSHRPKTLVVVLDSSVWIRLIRSRLILKLLVDSVANEYLEIASSDYILSEIESGLHSKLGTTKKRAKTASRLARRMSSIVNPSNIRPVCRYPSDDPVIALAVEVRAVYLVSEDQDILTLNKYQNTQMITTAEFREILGL